MINLKNFKELNIFFIGIGGISMSSLALISASYGAKVSGSDINHNLETDKLKNIGIKVYLGHNAVNITADINLVVFSGAIKEDNPEVIKAKALNITIMERSQFLGEILKRYPCSIAITGTHGKTTTTAMVSDIFLRAGLNPTVHLGGESPKYGNLNLGSKEIFITEGCEYRNSIQYLRPKISLITNIELDHIDYYKDLDEIEQSFLNFANNTCETVLIFQNNTFAKKITSKVNVITVGWGEEYDVVGKNLTLNKDGTTSFDVFYRGYKARFTTAVLGLHNANNALCAIAIALNYGIDLSSIYMAIREFKGVKRRYETIAKNNNTVIIADYAHHPTEITNSYLTTKKLFKNILVVFQPHTYSRTLGLKKEFIKCLKQIKNLVIFKTYPAREKYIVGGSAKELYNILPNNNKIYCDTLKGLKEILTSNKYDCILVVGAGDIYERAQNILKK